MQTKHLLSFLSAARAGSISKASFKLNYAQSTVYEHISALEKELETELYKRTSKGLELTGSGVQLVGYAEKILAVWDICKAEIKGTDEERIRICASESISKYYIYEILSEFMKKQPQAGIDLTLVPGTVAVERIRSGACDVALHFGVTPPIKNITTVKLFSTKMLFAAHPKHSFARCRERPKTIQRDVLVSNLDINYVKNMIESAGLVFDQIFCSYARVGGVDLAKNFPLEMNGVILLPEIALSEEIRRGELSVIQWLELGITQDAYLLTPEKSLLPSCAEELIEMILGRYKADVSLDSC